LKESFGYLCKKPANQTHRDGLGERFNTKASGFEIGPFREKSGTPKSLHFQIIIQLSHRTKYSLKSLYNLEEKLESIRKDFRVKIISGSIVVVFEVQTIFWKALA
jgi:hypothetical protein